MLFRSITDRTAEHIGKSDTGVVMLRRMFRQQMALVEDGNDPTVGFTRQEHDRIELPCEKTKFGLNFLEFALAWLDMGSSRYSPAIDALKKLHIDAAAIRGDVPGRDDMEVPGQCPRLVGHPTTIETMRSEEHTSELQSH